MFQEPQTWVRTQVGLDERITELWGWGHESLGGGFFFLLIGTNS